MRSLVFTIILCLSAPASAQPFNPMQFCQYPSQYAIDIFKKVVDETRKFANLPYTIICKNLAVPNAYALSYFDQLNGPQYTMHYNPMFMAQLDVSRQNDWAQIGVFAHEIGHLVEAAQTFNNAWKPVMSFNHPWQHELFADEHAGRVLARLGAEPKDIEEAQLFMFTMHGSPTHPDTISRLQALYKGYAQEGGDDSQLPPIQDISQNIFNRISRW